jgi:hypothetical protein
LTRDEPPPSKAGVFPMRREDSGHPRSPLQHYPSLASFYAADERRIDSRELDVGLWWRQGADGPLHRAAWVTDTGELYLVRLGPSGEGGGAVEVLATVRQRERLERALAGWRERCGQPRSLAWLRERAAVLGGRRRTRPPRFTGRPASAGAMLSAAAAAAGSGDA